MALILCVLSLVERIEVGTEEKVGDVNSTRDVVSADTNSHKHKPLTPCHSTVITLVLVTRLGTRTPPPHGPMRT